MQNFTRNDFKNLESRLNAETANNDLILFVGLSALIVLFGVCAVANEIFPKETLKEFSAAILVSLVWFIVRQELMMHRAGGYLELWRKIFDHEEKQEISPNTYKVRPSSWDTWRIDTKFRLLTLIISDLLSGSLGLLWLFRWLLPYPQAHLAILIICGILIGIGLVMIPITIVYAKKDYSIKFHD